MREDCLLNHHITMEIGLCQISLPPCGLSFSDVGEKKNKYMLSLTFLKKITLPANFVSLLGSSAF